MQIEKSHIPLYYQLEQVLREKILSGEFKPSEPIPTERELCDEFDISRTTVRQALISLEREGLLERVQGKGTFVSNRLKGKAHFRLFGFLEDLHYDTAKTTLTLHSKQQIVPDEKIIKIMKLEKVEKLYLFQGVRILETGHKAFYQGYICRNIGRKIRIDGSNHPFLIQRVELESRQRIKRARQVLYAAAVTEEMAAYMVLPVGSPLLVMSTVFFSRDNKAIALTVNYFPADAYRRVAELERVSE